MAGTGEIKYPGRTKTSTAALQFDTGISRARGRKPYSKIIWSSSLGVDAAGQPPAHRKKKSLKSPLETLWIDVTYDNISYVRGHSV